MVKMFVNLLSILNSNTKPGEIALGAVLGMFAAFMMPAPVAFWGIFLIALLLNCNYSFFLLSILIFKGLAFGIDHIGDKIGYAVLTAPFFEQLGSKLMAMPVVPFSKFNYTVIMGDFIIAIVLTPFVWIAMAGFVPFYRKNMQAAVDKFKIVKMVKMTNFYKIYENFKGE